MESILEKGASFIWQNARLLDRAIFEYFFAGASSDRIRSILSLYQNMDGGFGHALEPDLRAADSQPVFAEFALRTLYDCNLRYQDMAYRVCDFLSNHADLTHGIPTIFPSAMRFPHADHWRNPASQLPSMHGLVSLVGLLNWQGVHHPWLPGAVEACLQHLASTPYEDAHIILNAFCLVESLTKEQSVVQVFEKLSSELLKANYFCLEVPIKGYGLTPLTFAPSPSSFCRSIFSDSLIEAHLDELLSGQQPDGGWSILWNPPGDLARCEWRAQRTVMALVTLRAYRKI
jgi:hypothetical protein